MHIDALWHCIAFQLLHSHTNVYLQGVGSISPASASPLGSVNDSSTRKLLINLILTLNNTFSDYDFRALKPEDFVR